MNRSTRRQFLKSSGAVIATAIFLLGLRRQRGALQELPTGPDVDVMDMDMERDVRGRDGRHATAAADYFQ